MPLVKVKTKGQVTIPNELREEIGLNIGDFLRIESKNGKITLTPQSFIDRGIAQGLADIRAGREYGPFHSAEEMLADLHKRSRKHRRKTKS